MIYKQVTYPVSGLKTLGTLLNFFGRFQTSSDKTFQPIILFIIIQDLILSYSSLPYSFRSLEIKKSRLE